MTEEKQIAENSESVQAENLSFVDMMFFTLQMPTIIGKHLTDSYLLDETISALVENGVLKSERAAAAIKNAESRFEEFCRNVEKDGGPNEAVEKLKEASRERLENVSKKINA